MSHAGRAMAGTTVILGLGFSVYYASVMKNLQNFGLLIALTVVLALLVDLIFGPALIRTLFRDTPPDESTGRRAPDRLTSMVLLCHTSGLAREGGKAPSMTPIAPQDMRKVAR